MADGFRERTEELAVRNLARNGLSGFSVRVDDGRTILMAQFLEGEKEMYQLLVDYPPSEEDYMPRVAETFFASFAPAASQEAK